MPTTSTFAQLGPPDVRSRALKRQSPAWDHIYDPPEGWRYGFPKLYRPKHARENLAETLVRDGYPKKLAKKAAKHCRFWYVAKNPADQAAIDAATAMPKPEPIKPIGRPQ